MPPSRFAPSRRVFLRGTTLGALSLLGPTAAQQRRKSGGPFPYYDTYGPLAPVNDANTGLPLVLLPEGFRYTSFAWNGDPMDDGSPTPANADGMAVVDVIGGRYAVLVRNHELDGVGTPFAAPGVTYDAKAQGGTTTLVFDMETAQHVQAHASLSGTVRNCSGGATPWKSWISGEEKLVGPSAGYDEDHGWTFEVPLSGSASAVPILDMGRFNHESVAVNPASGTAYLTEDFRNASGFYRFRPHASPSGLREVGYAGGGTLEMLKVAGQPQADLLTPTVGEWLPVEWVPIDDPTLPPSSGVGPFTGFGGQVTSASGPFLQGWNQGAARFHRLEGATFHNGLVIFVDTDGGVPAPDSGKPEGVVWCYDVQNERARAIYASPAAAVLGNPDNIVVSPRGGILLCEDGGAGPERLVGLRADGFAYDFAQNNTVLNGEKNGIVGNFRSAEMAGACFDPTGTWLFVNVYSPGITLAITGPWRRGPL